jgi:hypothetical protein
MGTGGCGGTHRSPIKRGGGGGALNDVIKLKIINRMLNSGEKSTKGYEDERLRALAGRLNDPAKKMRPSNLSQETQRMLRV